VILAGDPGPHLYWLSSRAAGTAALVLASASVSVGALRAGGLAGGGQRGSRRRLELAITHEVLGLATIVALVIHGFVLIGDNFVDWSIADVAVPFVTSYHSGSNGIGIISGYVFILLSITYYVRDRIGETNWTALHRLVLLAWVGSFVHTLGVGTDKDEVWFRLVIFLPALVALGTLGVRLAGALRAEAPDRASSGVRPIS
jgi:methionine sulfoxide reductase heme-binding subunit